MKLSFDVPEGMLARLQVRYAEPHRRYHTWTHILACFDARDALTHARAPEVDLALLFHDAIYDPFAADNEARSAELLAEEARGLVDEGTLARAKACVLATRHNETPASPEAALVVDADLSILGADEGTFDLYEKQVREEYRQVDDAMFTAGRRRILEQFLARPHLYETEEARALWEARARANLGRSLRKLA